MRIRTFLVAAALAAAVRPASAQDLADLLPPDTAFAAHFDVARIAAFVGVDDLLARVGGDDGEEAAEVLRRLRRDLRFDPLADVCSVTLFGTDLAGGKPSVMIITSDAVDGAIETLRDAGGLRAVERDGLEFLRLDGAGVARALGFGDADAGDGDAAVLYVHRLAGGRRAILVGETGQDLAAGARALARREARRERPALELRPTADALVWFEVATSLEELARRTPASKLAGKIRRLSAEIAEDDGELALSLHVDVDSERDARDVAAIVNGLRALLSLADVDEDVPELARRTLAEARAEADGERVTVRLSVPAAELRDLLHEEVTGRKRAADRAEDEDRDRNRAERRRRVIR
jgi:hypothetical protein